MLKTQFRTREGKRPKQTFYCQRCQRYLQSRICAIHGVNHTVTQEVSNHKSLPSPEASFNTDERFSYPKHQSTEVAAEQPSLKNDRGTDRAFSASSDFFSTYIAEKVYTPEEEISAGPDEEVKDILDTLPEKDASDELPVSDPTRHISVPPEAAEVEDQKDELAKKEVKLALLKHEIETIIPSPEAQVIDEFDLPELDAKPAPPVQVVKLPAAPIEMESPQPETPPKPIEAVSDAPKRTPWMIAGATALLLLVGAATFISFSYPDMSKTSQFETAEAAFASGDYDQALVLFQQYKEEHPGAAAGSEADMRIEQIERIRFASAQKRGKVQELMENATRAFNQQRFMTPAGDNTISYLQSVLALEPGFPAAKDLEERVVEQYIVLAEKAFEADHYNDALAYYRNVLEIRPDDPAVVSEINSTLAVQQLDQKLNKLNSLASQRSTIRKLRREKAELKRQIQSERVRLKEIARQREEAEMALASKMAEMKAVEASLAVKSSTKMDLAIELADPSEDRMDDFITLDAKLVEETLIDGGKKRYIHREKPTLPANVKTKEMAMILAECIVGIDGNVETVELLSGTDNQRLNDAALASFKKFRYRPATHNGDPVRFKSLEVIAF